MFQIRAIRWKFAELLHGSRRHDVLPPPEGRWAIGEQLQYCEFDYLLFEPTGRSLFFVIRARDPLEGKSTAVTIEPINEHGEGVCDLVIQYQEQRLPSLVPHPLVYVLYKTKSESGAKALARLVKIADTAFDRLYPGGIVDANGEPWHKKSG